MNHQAHRGLRTAPFVAGLLALGALSQSALAQNCTSYQEVGGLLVIEVESTPPTGDWVVETSKTGFTGQSYYRWNGPDYFSMAGNGVLRYDFEIQTPGTYRLAVHNRHDHPDASLENDAWLRIDGGQWIKCYSNDGTGAVQQWIWETSFQVGSSNFAPEVQLGVGTHSLEFSGRSYNFMIDRFHLALPGHPDAKNKYAAVSGCASGGGGGGGDAQVYCKPKVNSLGCKPGLSLSPGQPSASAGAPWKVTGRFLINGQPGLFIYGDKDVGLPFQGGALCVRPPFERTAYQNTGGSGATGTNCTGLLTLDVNALIAASGSDPLLSVGSPLYMQAWYRDLNDVWGSGLTNGAAMVIQP
ncbi:MAG TPA: hypothetical protein VMT18_03510 [Planctomycetota bacterium]|nr:hypothetical protein [Planctomycetota bacterium]